MNMYSKSALITLVLIFQACYANCQCIDTTNIYQFVYAEKTYEIIKESKTWIEAAACAVERGGSLAEINSDEEQSAIFNEVSSNSEILLNNTVAPDGGGGAYVWIGGNDLSTEGNWIWDGNNDMQGMQFWMGESNGNSVNDLYSNWGNEPDDFGSGQDGLGLSLNGWPLGVAGQWNDVRHTNELYFVIEYPGFTSSVQSQDKAIQLALFPNPVQDKLTLELENGTLSHIIIYNTEGRVVRDVKFHGNYQRTNYMDLSDLNEGAYILLIETEDGQLTSKVLVK